MVDSAAHEEGACSLDEQAREGARRMLQSALATVRLRQRVTKGAGNWTRGSVMAFKLLAMAQQRWRKLNGAHLLPLVRAGVEFQDGRPVHRKDNDQKEAA